MQADGLQRSLNRFRDQAVSRVQRLARARELQQGIDEIRHQIHAAPNLLVEFFPLCGGEVGFHQELGIGDDGGQGMAEIVRDRTRHTANGGQLFRLQQIPLTLEQAGAHAVECTGQFRYFVPAARVQRMIKVTRAQGPYTAHQVLQGARECVRDKEHESAADDDRGQAQQKNVAIQLIQEFLDGLIGGQHRQAYRRSAGCIRKLQRGCEVALRSNLDVVRFSLDGAIG